MENKKGKHTKVVTDNVAAYLILVAIFLTFIITMGIYTFIENSKSVLVSSKEKNQSNLNTEKNETIEDLTSVENINSIEELQKLNEKELEEAKKKEEKNKEEIVVSPKYYIKVNYGAQVVTVYAKDSKGEYTKPVKAMVCSTGTYTPTSGVYKIPNKFRWLDMIGDVYAQYCTQIVGDILFHSVPYLEKYNNSSLEYWAYDQLGTRCSLGCVRLTCADAKWIYDNCKLGTQVEFYSSSTPGPLGKPTARKISSAPSNIRGWDPTDPADGNPWGKYLNELAEQEKNKKDEEIQNNEIKEPEILNEINNDEIYGNEILNEIVNELENEQTNETLNTVLNEEFNEENYYNEEVDYNTNKIENQEVEENNANELSQ